MDIFCDINYNNIASKIKENKYTETNQVNTVNQVSTDNNKNKSAFLIDEIFTRNDIEFCNTSNKDLYREQIKINIASKIDEESDKYYDCFNYKKNFSKKLIQSGLISCNKLSSILYLIDLYKCNIVIHDINEKKYICLSSKYPTTDVYCYNNYWTYEDTIDLNNVKYERYKKEHNYFDYDVKSLHIYNTSLKPIHNYKIDELVEIAKNKNINFIKNGKKLAKKDLFDLLYYVHI